jgi:hypothetical protein
MRNEYMLGENTHVLVDYENDRQTILCFKEKILIKREIQYKPNGHITQVRMKAVEDVILDDDVVQFSSAQMSICKYFLIQSTTTPGVTWRFYLTQRWSGKTITEAEESMLAQVGPECCVQCEAINTSSPTDVQQLLLFSSMILKIQDLLDLSVYQKDTKPSTQIPMFTFL